MRVIKGICYIIAACREYLKEIVIFPNDNDLVIAADGGYDILKESSIEPDIILGDFDSIKKMPVHKSVIKHPTEKDDTDTLLSYKLGSEKGYKNFVIFGGIGGRIDHTIANIRTLSEIADNDGRGFLIGNNTVITVIKNNKISFTSDSKGYISIFACDNSAEDITLKGLKYNTDSIDLLYSSSLGVSNEFCETNAEVSVKNGKLLIVWNEDETTFMNKISDFLL